MKHTPGPWKAHFEEAYFVAGPDLGRVAMMMNLKGAHGLGGRRSGDESAANCRLIAAAPDLLQGCKEALDALEALQGGCTDTDDGTVEAITVWCPEVVECLRAAIAKAEGQA
jgi:hypothetical protein